MADLRGRPPNFLNFIQFFGKFWQNPRLAPLPGGLAHPPTRNLGSANAEGKADYVLPSVCFTQPTWGGGVSRL